MSVVGFHVAVMILQDIFKEQEKRRKLNLTLIFIATKKRKRISKATRAGAAKERTGREEAIRGNGKETQGGRREEESRGRKKKSGKRTGKFEVIKINCIIPVFIEQENAQKHVMTFCV